MGSSGSPVPHDCVVRVGDPKSRSPEIRIEQRARTFHRQSHIVFDNISSFNPIFEEKGMALDVEGHIPNSWKAVNSVKGYSTIE